MIVEIAGIAVSAVASGILGYWYANASPRCNVHHWEESYRYGTTSTGRIQAEEITSSVEHNGDISNSIKLYENVGYECADCPETKTDRAQLGTIELPNNLDAPVSLTLEVDDDR